MKQHGLHVIQRAQRVMLGLNFSKMASLTFSFRCGLRGYHVYRTTWRPRIDEILSVKHEAENSFDRHAIAAIKQRRDGGLPLEQVVGHLPKEISRFIKFILIHGARVTVKVIDVDYRRSPLVQGGLEIPVLVSVAMDCSDSNKGKIKKLEILLNEYYKEPVNGKFEDATEAILRTIHSDDEDVDSTDDSGEDED